MADRAAGRARRSCWMPLQPIIGGRISTKTGVCPHVIYVRVCVCLSNSYSPRLFQGHHSHGHNDQWHSELQLRAGIFVPSQPIRAEMLKNREGQPEPYERHSKAGTGKHTRTCTITKAYSKSKKSFEFSHDIHPYSRTNNM